MMKSSSSVQCTAARVHHWSHICRSGTLGISWGHGICGKVVGMLGGGSRSLPSAHIAAMCIGTTNHVVSSRVLSVRPKLVVS